MFIPASIKADFDFTLKDQHGNKWHYEVSLKESTAAISVTNPGHNGQLVIQQNQGCFAIRERNGSIEVFMNGWSTPVEEMLEAYSNFIAEKTLLRDNKKKKAKKRAKK